jgi:hypothetical protein
MERVFESFEDFEERTNGRHKRVLALSISGRASG